MAKFENVQLVAFERGFRDGAMVEPGEAFVFSGDRLPKWAAKAEDAAKRLAAKTARPAGDLKPKAAQSAVKAKAQAISA